MDYIKKSLEQARTELASQRIELACQTARVLDHSAELADLQRQLNAQNGCEDQYEYMIVKHRGRDDVHEHVYEKTVATKEEALQIVGRTLDLFYVRVKKQAPSKPEYAIEYVYDLVKLTSCISHGFQYIKTTKDLSEAREWYNGRGNHFVRRKVTHA